MTGLRVTRAGAIPTGFAAVANSGAGLSEQAYQLFDKRIATKAVLYP